MCGLYGWSCLFSIQVVYQVIAKINSQLRHVINLRISGHVSYNIFESMNVAPATVAPRTLAPVTVAPRTLAPVTVAPQ
jgi:hypothetical protein